MKFIDEKGRLFSKINLIDFLVIVFLLGFVPMFYFGYKIIAKRPMLVPIPKDTIQTEINCKFIKVTPEILKEISVGDKEVNEKGEVIGEIVWLGEVKPYQYEFDLGTGQTATKEDPVLKEVPVKLRLKVAIKNKMLYYDAQQNATFPITAGIPFDFSTSKYTLKVFLATTKEMDQGELTQAEINCKFIKVTPEILKQISVGDKEVNEKGEVIGEIVWLGEVKPYQYEFDLGTGQTATKEDPVLKEVPVKLRLKVAIKNKMLYYKNEQLLVSFPFGFKTRDYSLQAIPAIISKAIQGKWVKIKIKSLSIIPDVADILREDDSQKDMDEKTVATLEEIVSNNPSEILIMGSGGNWSLVHHPSQKDIVTNWGVLCIEKNGVLYFNNYPIKIGNTVNFMTDLYSISGTIIDLKIK